MDFSDNDMENSPSKTPTKTRTTTAVPLKSSIKVHILVPSKISNNFVYRALKVPYYLFKSKGKKVVSVINSQSHQIET